MSGIMLMIVGREPGLFKFNISTNAANTNLRTLAINAGWNQSSAVEATVPGGIYIYSFSTSTPALTINGSWPGGVTLINNGFIMGMGGAGATSAGGAYTAAFSGGPAISLGVNCSIINNGYIGGGGGGGGAGVYPGGGGGAGGGAGGYSLFTNGGFGGDVGAAGTDGVQYINAPKYIYTGGGGGGGRIMPGTGGAGGAGGAGNNFGRGGGAGGGGGGDQYPAAGGAGGSAGGSGANGAYPVAGGGGGWGAAGGNSGWNNPTSPGGSGGAAILLNGYTATRTGPGSTYGTVS